MNAAFKRLRSKGKLNESDVKEAMREVRLAMLEADVNYKVAKDFTNSVTEKCIGEKVMESLTAPQMVVKIVRDELTALLGGEHARINMSSKIPTIIMMCGLQGSGKTTHLSRIHICTAFQNGVLQDPITPPSDAAAGVPADMEPASQQNTLQEGNTVSSVVSSVVSRDDGGASSPETEGTVSHPETSLPTAGEDEPLGDASSAPSVSSDEQAASVPAVSDTTSLTSGEGESVSRQETPADAESESR